MCQSCPSRRAVLRGAAAAALVPLAACDAPEIRLVSEAQAEAMGAEAWSEIRARTQVTRDARFASTVAEVSGRLLAAAGEPADAWEVVAFDSPEVNAFALPGRRIGVHAGLWEVAGGPAQLAAVIGHEIGHLDADHARERMSAQIAGNAVQRLVRLALGAAEVEFAPEIAAALGLGLTYGVLLPYSRRQELEADALGLRHMARAGYDPAEAALFWQRMEAATGARPPAILATHPAPEDRIEAIEDMLPELRRL